jgi:hypothetical protein
MVYGNKPADGGHLYLEADEYSSFIEKEPLAAQFIKRIYGSREYINNICRYCLWLVGANPGDLKKLPLVMDRIDKTRQFRLSSPKIKTRESAKTPSLFQEIRQTDEEYVLVPCVSSERRTYIPIGFVAPDIITNNSVMMIPGATIYHFGILTSIVHMAWARAVCGRLDTRYRYSKDIVYNNFPWPEVTDSQRKTISERARDVLEARSLFPNSDLANLYDPLLMPPELLIAHQKLDRAVMELYGFKDNTSWNEEECVAKLIDLYKNKILIG